MSDRQRALCFFLLGVSLLCLAVSIWLILTGEAPQ